MTRFDVNNHCHACGELLSTPLDQIDFDDPAQANANSEHADCF